MEMLFMFITPYLSASITGGYSLVQVLDVLDFISTSSDYGLFNGRFMIVYNVIFLFYMLFVFLFNIIASFSLSNKLPIFLLLFWLLPGFLQVVGLIEIKPIIEVYSIGTGRIGNIQGLMINAFLIVILSWSLATVFLHTFRLGKKFKSFYDHIWYLFGLSVLIFFMADFNKEVHEEELKTTLPVLEQSISILNNQFISVEKYCKVKKFKNDFSSICKWVTYGKHYTENLEWKIGHLILLKNDTPNMKSILEKSSNVDNLILEVNNLNNMCTKRNYNICIKVPFELNGDPVLLKTNNFPQDKYILPIKQLMPTITSNWKNLQKIKEAIKEDEKLWYKKWLFFMFLSVLVGIKISNSSREIFGGKNYSVYISKVIFLLKLILNMIMNFFKVFIWIFSFLKNYLRIIVNK